MNRSKLKTYAPKARRDFIQAVTDRAALHGLTVVGEELQITPITVQGDVAIIAGKPFPKNVAEKRKLLEQRIYRLEVGGMTPTEAFAQIMEAMAYTWFNRLVAIRFMELHGYLDHGYRVLSNSDPAKTSPEILDHAEHIELPGLDKQKIIDLKLDGNKEQELYQILLIAQCNALHQAMLFLFERINDETELLLPDNLLHSDSLIRKLVGEIDEEDWQQVEIIGWLYQFYISEKKDEVIGKVVASEDIPAATQLFTPNWIVKYLVQNTLGRQWLATYPQSALRQQMQYYIEPAEQTPEVQEQLKAITPTSLNPEELTMLDPACGSGHILVEAYDLFKAIYQERGYRAKDIPALILQKNLFGLEIDDRAAQLAAFALMMKARADDRRIFDSEAKPNFVAIQDSQGMYAADITHALNSPILKEKLPPSGYLIEEIADVENPLFGKKMLAEKGHVSQGDIGSLLALFENAKTFGSLIQVPQKLAAKLPEIEKRLEDVLKFGDLSHATAYVIKPLLQQARLLSRHYDAVVANPPYMGNKFFSGILKDFAGKNYQSAKADLYSCFIDRSVGLTKSNGFAGLITIPNWMFLSSFEDIRRALLAEQTIDSFLHNGRGVFGSDFGSCSFVLRTHSLPRYRASFYRLFDKDGEVRHNDELESRLLAKSPDRRYERFCGDFARIPGCPIAYWATEKVFHAFSKGVLLGEYAEVKRGMTTSDNARFLRQWFEVAHPQIRFGIVDHEQAVSSGGKWFPYSKGGGFRKWFGFHESVINWENGGRDVIEFAKTINKSYTRTIVNIQYYFQPSVAFPYITISRFSLRLLPPGFVYDSGGPGIFTSEDRRLYLVALLNSEVAHVMLKMLSPSINLQIADMIRFPVLPLDKLAESTRQTIASSVAECVALSKADWNSFETAWDFEKLPIFSHKRATLVESQKAANADCVTRFARMKQLEEENNRHFIEAYALQGELSPEVPDDQITLYRPERVEDIKRLLSCAIGCMMGRYSLDKPGLIYAHSGNQDFDSSQYKTFHADDDGIIPLLETDWGILDDASNRIVEFVAVAWPKEHLEDNLKFIADSLGPNNSEQPRETIRRYLATGFYKHHLSMYKKRPIYWLFSSGKLGSFQCLVYLHRYNSGTLARMRTEYVIPLQGKINSRIEQLEGDITKAASPHERRLRKEQEILKKQQVELVKFDEKLRQYADQRIELDLDDGVKVNYAKFGDLLACVTQVCGKGDEDE